MTRMSRFLSPIVCCLIIVGCGAAGKAVNLDPSNPAYALKSEFELNYGFFITSNERKNGYATGQYPNLTESIRPFDEIDTLEEFRRFEDYFWKIRDTDPNTPENEFKELIDSRIQDVKNEIFTTDRDILGTRFERSGGLRGDLAHVYLFYGMPSLKAKLAENNYHVEMVVWYYLDGQGKTLMSFLFYRKFNRLRIFQDQASTTLNFRLALEEISRKKLISDDEFLMTWNNLVTEDPQGLFRSAMLRFSYDVDITLQKALASPEPAALMAERFRPIVLGQSDIPEGTELFESDYHSLLPADLDIVIDPAGAGSSFSITIAYADLDWEFKDKMAEAVLNVRISFQNTETRTLNEFETNVELRGPQRAVEVLIRNVIPARTIVLDEMPNGLKKNQTLRQLIDNELKPGNYVVNIYLQHVLTKKNNAWSEEIVIR